MPFMNNIYLLPNFGEAQPGDTYTCGVRIECEFALCAGSATARAVVRTVGVCGICDAMLLGRMSYAQPEFFDILSTPPCRLKGVTPKAKAEGT